MYYQIYEVMVSISTGDMVHFSMHLLNRNSLTHKTSSIGVNKSNIFLKSFEQFRRLGLSSRLFSIWQPAPITQEPIMSSFQCYIFLKGRIENYKDQLHKIDRSRYIIISLKSLKGLELVSSPQ